MESFATQLTAHRGLGFDLTPTSFKFTDLVLFSRIFVSLLGTFLYLKMLLLTELMFRTSQMKELFELCRSKVKIWKSFANGTHNETVAEPGYFEAIDDFIKTHVEKR